MSVAKAQRGFSLAEALVAVAILAMIGGISFGTFGRAMSARERAVEITDRYHDVRQAMLRMSREISQAFLSQHRDCSDIRTQTAFVGKSAGHGMRLDFTSFSHFKTVADANESDQNELSYFVARDVKDATRQHLMRREQNRIDEHPDEGGKTYVLAEDVESLEFAFYDSKNDRWEDEWDATARDMKNRIPKFVKIKLKVKDANGRSLSFVTKTRTFIRDAIVIPGAGFSPCIE